MLRRSLHSRSPLHEVLGVPDAGAQRKEMIGLLKRLAGEQEEVNTFFKSGQLRVKMDVAPSNGNRPG